MIVQSADGCADAAAGREQRTLVGFEILRADERAMRIIDGLDEEPRLD
jgi:hypothetical protein